MKNKYFLFILLIVGFSFCNQNKNTAAPEQEGNTTTIEVEKDSIDQHTAKNSLDWSGTYKGEVPCADCAGIETEVKLNKDETYFQSTGYEGKKKIEHSENNGSFIWIDGSTIKLEDAQHRPVYYFVGENYLRQLDITGKEITGSLAENYILKKI